MRGRLVGTFASLVLLALLACEEGPPSKTATTAVREQTDLPWPLPIPSTSMEIPREFCAPAEADSHLTRAADWLSRALRDAGYADLRYYDIPEGFALATPLELIDDQGLATAPPDPALRFSAKYPPLGFFTMRFWSELLAGKAGRFRLLVFVVIDHPFGYSKDVTDAEVMWKHPSPELPLNRADLGYKKQDKWYALVYEIERDSGTDHVKLVANPSEPSLHLTKSGILAALEHEAHEGESKAPPTDASAQP